MTEGTSTQPKTVVGVGNDTTSSDSNASLSKQLHVTGSEFVSALKDAMVEIDASMKHREEIQSIASFLVAFHSTDSTAFLSEDQLSQLTFTFRIESVEQTRSCLLKIFRSGSSNVAQTKRYRYYHLVPTEAFVSYLCTRTYYRQMSADSTESTPFKFPIRESGEFWSSKKHQFVADEEEDQQDKVWTKQELILTNFLHFLVNMFARNIPGNLLYGIENASCKGDFFFCIKFLQETLLANPMDLRRIYERIWDQFQRLSRDPGNLARVNELKLFCLPIINKNWDSSVLRHMPDYFTAGFIDKDTFLKVCSDCIMWTEIEDKSKAAGRDSHVPYLKLLHFS
ncbi:hypothetical protein BOX15_Mlig008212g1 [Macrostomum lignano]|uniref:Uncharacterized protein n=1 Tax=Macrostomum lignano TaxID=282301 RepID=A0A267H1W4_9PLAT|nr:hypothetical protein BOX15_Mlig008212g1 [Macrostomum lignano]